MVRKDLAIASLEVDPENGKVWLNTDKCILRITGLEFTTKSDDFTMLDVFGKKAQMVESQTKPQDDDLLTFLMNSANFLKSEMDHNPTIVDKGAFLERMLATMRQMVDRDYRVEGGNDANSRHTVV